MPQSWADLLKPEYKGLVGYLDPASAFVGYVGAVAVNQAMGGTLDNFQPAIDYFKKLQKNEPIVPKQTSYARLLSGEIGILLDYDFNAYRARYKDKADVDFVIPKEGTVVMPYVMSLVNKAPHTDNGKKVLDYVLSDKGQSIWANAYLRPVRDVALPKEVAGHFLPASEYARATSVDYQKMADVQRASPRATCVKCVEPGGLHRGHFLPSARRLARPRAAAGLQRAGRGLLSRRSGCCRPACCWRCRRVKAGAPISPPRPTRCTCKACCRRWPCRWP